MSLTTRVLIGLVAGLAAGIAVSLSASPALLAAAGAVKPIGTLWVNAIRMTVIPLVVASLVVGVANAPDVRAIGRVGWRALLLFLAVLFAGAIFAVLAGQPLLARLTIDPVAAAALRESAAAGAPAAGAAALPGWSQWLVDLVPVNPMKAAADGAMLPLIVFTLAFAVALLRVPPERRQPVVAFFGGVFDASLVLVRWVLALAPVGVFALALPLAATMGLAAAGALGYYVLLVSLLSVIFSALVLYPAAVVLGRVPLRRFARAAAPAQAVALSSRSSLASLPAMIEGATDVLRLPVAVSSFFLPLAASVFRAGAGVGVTTGIIFLARLYDVPLGGAQLASVVLTVVLTSFSVPGIPGGSILVMLPALAAAGIPEAGVGLLLGIDTIPDMFRTATNVTGHMSAAVIVARGVPEEPAEGGAESAPMARGEAALREARSDGVAARG
ncbi:MAG TPA: dicarboxylate/amino acid:cation symporter [Gemmatimonadaceae bacterium]|nr:dicarboxylate/amino acid:cation symporter [Gemmatimonadaceae bacterium]